MRNKLGLPNNVAVTSMGQISFSFTNLFNIFSVLNLAEQTNKVFEEIADYTSDQFLAEIGGSAGLFLGLSLLTIVEFFASLFLLIFSKTMRSWKKRHQKMCKKDHHGVDKTLLSEKFTSTSGYFSSIQHYS